MDNKINNNKKTNGNGKNGNHKKMVRKFEMKFKVDIKNFILYVLVGFLILSFFLSFSVPVAPLKEVPLSQVLTEVKDGKVKEITVEGDKLTVVYKDSTKVVSYKERGESVVKTFEASGINPKDAGINIKDQSTTDAWINILSTLLPTIFIAGLLLFMFRQAKGAQDSVFNFGASRAKIFSKDTPKVTFNDVAGVDEAKKELEEVVDFLKNPKKYQALGARTPKGVLLIGPSGCGKTLLARAVAGQAGVPFFSMAGSEFMEMLVGVGASRARDLFSTAKKHQPAIVFIDEIDAIGRQRGYGLMGGHDEREQTLNQILVEMDGFTPNEQLVVVAASVVGDTPVLVKTDGEAKLLNIGELIDSYYEGDKEGEIEVSGLETLGMVKKKTRYKYSKNLLFGGSAFCNVRSVFRHKVNEIYEIKYLGGEVMATGNHSVFVRSHGGLVTKAVSELKKGDFLIDLPFKVNRTNKDLMEVRAHNFDSNWKLKLPVYIEEDEDIMWQGKYLYAVANEENISQSKLGMQLGISQRTVGLWQNTNRTARAISREYFKYDLPSEVVVTTDLMRLLGYYTAEGYSRKEVDFCFGVSESDLITDLVKLMKDIFGLDPDRILRKMHGAVNIIYYSKPLARFFAKYCGKGARNKHVPNFLFEAPKEFFLEYLKAVIDGDGYFDKNGRAEVTTVSKKLAMELNWLSRMHGLKSYIGGFTAKKGRIINGGKPLPETVAYRLGFGKANNPFFKGNLIKKNSVKRAKVISVEKMLYKGFVYDFCGVVNEAFFGGEGPILLHNTNRPDVLDPALVRPGRFDRRVIVDMPDLEGRKAILKIHMKNKPFANAQGELSVDWERVAKRTVGFSGADLENMLNEAAILAARLNKTLIDMSDLEEAATKVKMGPEKKRMQSDLDKKMTAYHEAGHAVVTFMNPRMDPVHRISIVSRGHALGYTLIPPEKDVLHETKTKMVEQISTMFGGRAAEEIVFNDITSGASNDIDQATQIAREMVVEFGMSDLGPINFGPNYGAYEWGKTWTEQPAISPDMQSKIDDEIKKLIDAGHGRAVMILKKMRKQLDLVANELIKKETLDGEEFEKLMGIERPKV